MAKRLLVLQHIACEPPGVYEEVLRERGLPFVRVELDEGEAPDWRRFNGILVMGGPMGTGDEHEHPWLRYEKEMVAEAVGAGIPYWGTCLGAQLLAAALGAKVYPGPEPEIGVHEITTNSVAVTDPVFRLAPKRFPAFHWHSDTFDLPAGARLLAGSAAYPHQAFAVGEAYGLQFHLEATPRLASQWAQVPAYAAGLDAALGPRGLSELMSRLVPLSAEISGLARALFGAWLDGLDGRRGGRRCGSRSAWSPPSS